MASSLIFCKFSIFLFLFSFLAHVSSTEFEVGGDDGWVVPKAKDEDNAQMYNHWASGKRFKIGDTIQFKYEKDSIMEVSDEEYKKCRSSHPLFYSNNGNTVFKLDRPGLFYFISGVSGHCERGQKMIIKVLEPAANHTQSQNQNNTTPDSSKKNIAAIDRPAIASPTIFLIIMSFSGLIFYQF